MDHRLGDVPPNLPFTRQHRAAWWKAHEFLLDGGEYEVHAERDGWPGTINQLRTMVYRRAAERGVGVTTSVTNFEVLRVNVPALAPVPEKSPLARLRDERLAQEAARKQQEDKDLDSMLAADCTCGQYPRCAPSCFVVTGIKPVPTVLADVPGSQDLEPGSEEPRLEPRGLLKAAMEREQTQLQRPKELAITASDLQDQVPAPQALDPMPKVMSQETLALMFPGLNLGQQRPRADS
jgi:hypothetical protein